MFGDLDMPEADWTAREVCARTGAVVVSVDYRLAVGGVHHPVPLDDCVAATRWLRDSAAELGVDPARITVGGASAGGNLATAAVLRLRDEDGWLPAALIPVYPVLHPALPEPSPEVAALLDEVPPALRFTPEGTAGINANYLGGQAADGYSFPALADLTGLGADSPGQRRSTTTCAPPARRSPTCSGRPVATCGTCRPTACCTASSTSRRRSNPSTPSST